MADKDDKNRQFSLKTLLRLFIFSLLLYYLFAYLGQSISQKHAKPDPTVLGQQSDSSEFFQDAYQSLSPTYRQKLENLNQFPPYLYLQGQYDYLLDQASGFPQKQINQIKKDIIQSIYQDLMKNLDGN